MPINFGGDARRSYDESSNETQKHAFPVLEFLSDGFTITWFRELQRPKVWIALLKPQDHVAEFFTLRMEYLLIGHSFAKDFQQRTLLAEPPEEIAYRVDRRVRFVASNAPMMKAACAAWATQERISVVPLDLNYRRGAGDGSSRLDRLLATALWLRDVFDDPEPVADPAEFFGRELAVQQVVTKVFLGQLTAIFGLRKIGKTSLIRRVRDLLDADPTTVNITALIQCNATRIKAGRWHVVVKDLVEAWSAEINRRGGKLEQRIEVRAAKVGSLLGSGRPVPTDAAFADAFQKDAERLVRAARSLAKALGVAQVRLVAFFDEADELYPHRADAGFWREDYFSLWNAMQTLKRGGDDPRELVYVLGGVNPAGVESGALMGRANPLFELSPLYLKPLQQEEVKELLRGLGSRVGLSFQDDAIDAAFTITGGHPWLLRKLGSQIHKSVQDHSSNTVVTRERVEGVFAKSRWTFHQHVAWILSHLRDVANDEYRLLKDIAAGGKEMYFGDWADERFRETFAEHLVQYGVLRFDGEIPSITIGLVREALKQPAPSDLPDRKRQIREAGDTLESLLRLRIVSDVSRDRTLDEAVKFMIHAVPREAKNRPKGREELEKLGLSAGLQALVEALNWGDYILIVSKSDSGVVWSGPELTPEDRKASIVEAVGLIHMARHNNDAELRKAIDEKGFEMIWQKITQVQDMLSQ